MSSLPVKNFIRNRDFFKIISSIETGAEHGMWTFARYRTWLDKRTAFHSPWRDTAVEEEQPVSPPAQMPPVSSTQFIQRRRPPAPSPASPSPPTQGQEAASHRIEIEPTEEFDKILKPPS